MAIQADGKIVVAGDSNVVGTSDFALVRYNADGSLDTSFDGDGKVTTPIGSEADGIASAWRSRRTARLSLAGFPTTADSTGFALARYNADGSLDTSFDGDGMLTTAIGGTGMIAPY